MATGAISNLSNPTQALAEDDLLGQWARDIRRAARFAASAASASDGDAADFEQEIRLRLVRAIRVAGAALPDRYLRTVIRNHVLTLIRDRRREWYRRSKLQNDLSLGMSFDCSQGPTAGRLAVRQWVEQLPAPLHRVYDLLYVRDCSQRQAARIMGCTQPRIAQLHRQLLTQARRTFV